MLAQDSAFWVWNLVANIAYGERADVAMPVIQSKIRELENNLLKQTAAVDHAAKQVCAVTNFLDTLMPRSSQN